MLLELKTEGVPDAGIFTIQLCESATYRLSLESMARPWGVDKLMMPVETAPKSAPAGENFSILFSEALAT